MRAAPEFILSPIGSHADRGGSDDDWRRPLIMTNVLILALKQFTDPALDTGSNFSAKAALVFLVDPRKLEILLGYASRGNR
jgi:hypothetical protein